MKQRKNMTASVKQRLLNLARNRGEGFNLLLTRYGIERLLYWLSRSVLLDHPAPRVCAYRRETVVSEKLQAMVGLGMANSRMKDFFDLRFLAVTFDFDGPDLARAIEATFSRRGTPVPGGAPTTLTNAFAEDSAKQTQWRSFLSRSRLEREDLELEEVIAGLRDFLLPPIEALAGGKPFDLAWNAGGPWHPVAEPEA